VHKRLKANVKGVMIKSLEIANFYSPEFSIKNGKS